MLEIRTCVYICVKAPRNILVISMCPKCGQEKDQKTFETHEALRPPISNFRKGGPSSFKSAPPEKKSTMRPRGRSCQHQPPHFTRSRINSRAISPAFSWRFSSTRINLKPERLGPARCATHGVVVVRFAVGSGVRLPVRCTWWWWWRRRRRRWWWGCRGPLCIANAVCLGKRALQEASACGAEVGRRRGAAVDALAGALRRHVHLKDVTRLRFEGNLVHKKHIQGSQGQRFQRKSRTNSQLRTQPQGGNHKQTAFS